MGLDLVLGEGNRDEIDLRNGDLKFGRLRDLRNRVLEGSGIKNLDFLLDGENKKIRMTYCRNSRAKAVFCICCIFILELWVCL